MSLVGATEFYCMSPDPILGLGTRLAPTYSDSHTNTHTHKVDHKQVNMLTNKYLVSVSAMLNTSIITQDSSHYQ